MNLFFRLTALTAISLASACSGLDDDTEVDSTDEELGEAAEGIRGGQAAFSAAPEVVSLRFRNVGEDINQCSGLTLSSRYILTAAHCVIGFTSFGQPRPPLFIPQREGTLDQLEVRVTFGSAANEISQTSFFGSATVIVYSGFASNGSDPDDDLALVRTDDTIAPHFRARLLEEVESPHAAHFVTGWRPLDEEVLGRQKTRGLMPFGAWNSWEGLKLNTGDTGVVPINGDSGGGASLARKTTGDLSVDIYDGVLAERVTGGPWPGVTSARLYDKINWIENTASIALGSRITFNHFRTKATQINPTTLPYVRIGTTP